MRLKGQIEVLVLVMIFAILLSGGFRLTKLGKKSGESQDQQKPNPIEEQIKKETFTSPGACCDTGDGAACQVVDSDCFNFRGPEYCRIKSNIALYEGGSGWIKKENDKHNGNPIYTNTSNVAGVDLVANPQECGLGINDQLHTSGAIDECIAIPDESIIYVCKNDCPQTIGPPGNTVLLGGKNVVYDAYFRKTDTIPDSIKYCVKSTSRNSQPQQKLSVLTSVFMRVISMVGAQEVTPKKSLQIEKLPIGEKKEAGEEKKQPKIEVKVNIANWLSPYCKPAIYLYPPEKMDVNVKIAPRGKLTLTIPKYSIDGWKVIAYPNGRIDTQNSSFEYLYYEAQIPDSEISEPREGFVVDYKNLENFLSDLLPSLGLNEKEANEFKSYWIRALPKFQYYYIGVISKSTLDQIAPLTINPKPDNIIRVTLYFKALDKKIEVKSPKISTPNRTGFTVVEWGGIFKTDKNHPFSCLM